MPNEVLCLVTTTPATSGYHAFCMGFEADGPTREDAKQAALDAVSAWVADNGPVTPRLSNDYVARHRAACEEQDTITHEGRYQAP